MRGSHHVYFYLLVSVLEVSLVSSLQCYTCSGKKSQCETSSDPGQETECPSIFSLIRPKVMLTLGRNLLAFSQRSH